MKKSIQLLKGCNLVVATLLMIYFICGCEEQPKYALPEILYADVKVQSVGGTSLFDTKQPITIENFTDFYSDPKVTMEVVGILRSEGFRVLHVSKFGINIAAPPEVFEQVFKTKIIVKDLTVKDKGGVEKIRTVYDVQDSKLIGFIDPSDSPLANLVEGVEKIRTVYDVQDSKLIGFIDPSDSPLANLVEGVALSEPVEFFQSPTPPPVNYYHLEVPDDVSQGLNAAEAHSKGCTGKGVKVIMIDTGWYRHPFFDDLNYNIPWVVLGPGVTDTDLDNHGHGTGISSNLFAVAPDADLLVIKMPQSGEEWGINAVACFNVAVDMKPDIITCSWGRNVQHELEEAWMYLIQLPIYEAVHNQGITVVWAAGNGEFGFPSQMPCVIAVGGAYIHQDSSIETSKYTSGFESEIYEGRIVPDVCGLVGIRDGYLSDDFKLSPGGMYIMMPTQPGSEGDVKYHNNGAIHYRNPNAVPGPPHGDETAINDGWAVFSGTSSAAPQIAGICALLKEIHPAIQPSYVKKILQRTARDVVLGKCSDRTGGHAATPDFDTATGEGLVDALSAVSYLEDLIEVTGEFPFLVRVGMGQYYRYLSESNILQLYIFPEEED